MCPIVPAGGRHGRLRLPAPAAHLLAPDIIAAILDGRLPNGLKLAEMLVHRGVQKIHPFGALAWPEPRKCGVRRQGRVNLLSAPVH
jgi:hypothetical protein